MSQRFVHPATRVLTAVLTFSLCCIIGSSVTQAATATKSATVTPPPIATGSASTTQKLKERIDKVIEQRKAEVKGAVDQLTSPRRGFIGEVQRVTEKTITLKTKRGTQILNITDEVILIKDGKKVSINEIAIGDWSVAMGYLKEQEFLPQRLLFSAKSLEPTHYQVALGNIDSLTTSKLVMTARGKSEPITVTLNRNTQYQDQNGKTLTRDKVPAQVQALLIYLSQDQEKVATVIRILVPITPNG